MYFKWYVRRLRQSSTDSWATCQRIRSPGAFQNCGPCPRGDLSGMDTRGPLAFGCLPAVAQACLFPSPHAAPCVAAKPFCESNTSGPSSSTFGAGRLLPRASSSDDIPPEQHIPCQHPQSPANCHRRRSVAEQARPGSSEEPAYWLCGLAILATANTQTSVTDVFNRVDVGPTIHPNSCMARKKAVRPHATPPLGGVPAGGGQCNLRLQDSQLITSRLATRSTRKSPKLIRPLHICLGPC